MFRGKPFPGKVGSRDGKKREIRWSDCGCESCGSWMNNVDQRLHVVVREPSKGTLMISQQQTHYFHFTTFKARR